MASLIPWALTTGAGLLANKISSHYGDNNDVYQQSKLTPQQKKIEQQRLRALTGPGGEGAYGQAADYYRDLLDPNSKTAQGMFAPETRRFNEETIPGLAEQFAGMGAGGLSSSGFRNAGVAAGTDLSERLGAIRANLASQGAAGLVGIGNSALTPTVENLRDTPQSTFGENLAEGIGSAIPSLAQSYFDNKSNVQQAQTQIKSQGLRNTSPYGNKSQQRGLTPNTSGPRNGPTFLGY